MERKTDDEGSIAIASGAVTIEEVAALKSELAALIDAQPVIRVRFEPLRALDVAGFQLFCSAHRTAVARDRELVLEGEIPELARELACEVGPCTVRGRANGYCFWRGETRNG